MDAMAAIKETFFQECEEQLAELETGLLAVQNGDTDPETVNAVFRAVHSIKGGAGAFSLDDLVRFAHVFETALDHLRAGKIVATPEILSVMLRAADVLADLVRAARDGGSIDDARSAALNAELAKIGSPDGEAVNEAEDALSDFDFQPVQMTFDELESEPVETHRLYNIYFKPHHDLYAKANEAATLLRELGRLGDMQVVCDYADLPLLTELDPEGAYLAFRIELLTSRDERAIHEIFEFVEWDCEFILEGDGLSNPTDDDVAALIEKMRLDSEGATATANAAPKQIQAHDPVKSSEVVDLTKAREAKTVHEADEASQKGDANRTEFTRRAEDGVVAAQATIRVDLDRVDRLIDLVGELVINQAMLAQRVTEAGLASMSGVATGLDELEQLTREIQDSVMAIRAQPVKSVFQRMPRLVREVAAMTGKSVRLITEGENTEVDKTVIERLADPLTHMIRNAIDHGLEKTETRLAAGKSAEGTVRLSALHRSGRIVIEVSDDGAGINRSRVKAIAVDKGLVAPDAVLSDDEIDNLIFLPGFSTAAAISDISGRGVGMDVVRRSIQALGGRITITSQPRTGSTFTMSLPLTLAVLDGMVVTVAEQTLVVPLTAIIETLLPKEIDVHGFGGDTRVMAVRNQFTPLIDVGRELNYRCEATNALNGVAILVESEGGVRSALLVDAIQGQRQVVIKSLEANYRHVPGIAAATILGDGRVALILDVDAVVASSRAGTEFFEPLFAAAV